jgi:hypothetical protein
MDITFKGLQVIIVLIITNFVDLTYLYSNKLNAFSDGKLKETDIGRHVNQLRKHEFEDVRILVKHLVRFEY